MTGSFLDYLDILIGFAMVMLIVSSLVTVITNWVLNFANYRGYVLRFGLMQLIKQVQPSLSPHAMELARTVLKHPLVASHNWRGGEQEGTVIQREELIRVLLDLAASSDKLTPEIARALRIALGIGPDDTATPKQILEAIEKRTMELEVASPGLSGQIIRTQAIVEKAAGAFVTSLMAWFDDLSGRMTQFFAKRARAITIIVAAVIALTLPLDSIALIKRLSIDDALRARLVAAAQKATEEKSPIAGVAVVTEGAAKAEGETKETATGDAASGDATKGGEAKPEETKPDESIKVLVAEWRNLDVIQVPELRDLITIDAWFARVRSLPGIALTIALLSLGAPFWFEALKNLLRLRPVLAQKEEEDRKERKMTA